MISFSEAKAAARRKKRPERILQLHLAVQGVDPRIWRRLLVRETMWLSRLHDAIQLSFGWFDYQLHRFMVNNLAYGNPLPRDGEAAVEDDRDFSLADLHLAAKETFHYDYCFGDGWSVEIRVEKTEPAQPRVKYPVIVDGRNSGPPEDCGGPEGFKEVLHSLKHPDEPLSHEWLEWLGGGFDPERFEREKLNRALARLPR